MSLWSLKTLVHFRLCHFQALYFWICLLVASLNLSFLVYEMGAACKILVKIQRDITWVKSPDNDKSSLNIHFFLSLLVECSGF